MAPGKKRPARASKPPAKAKRPAPRPSRPARAPPPEAFSSKRPPPRLVLEQPAAVPPEPKPPVPDFSSLEGALQRVTPAQLAAEQGPPEPGRTPKRFILLDTNALMMQFQFSVDVESEMRRILDIPYEILIPQLVVEELKHLVASAPTAKDRGEAMMALRLAHTFRVCDSDEPGDTGILRLAEKLGAIVVTNDKILRARLRAKNIPNIHLRSKAFLTVEGHVGF